MDGCGYLLANVLAFRKFVQITGEKHELAVGPEIRVGEGLHGNPTLRVECEACHVRFHDHGVGWRASATQQKRVVFHRETRVLEQHMRPVHSVCEIGTVLFDVIEDGLAVYVASAAKHHYLVLLLDVGQEVEEMGAQFYINLGIIKAPQCLSELDEGVGYDQLGVEVADRGRGDVGQDLLHPYDQSSLFYTF